METMPGGHYESWRWKLSSFWNHGLLLAVTVLCVDLNKDSEDGLMNESYWNQDSRRELAEALRSAQSILLQSWSISADARKGATAVEVVLSKAGLGTDTTERTNMGIGDATQICFPPQTPSWSLEEFLGAEFPPFQSWVSIGHDSPENNTNI
jgi:hypothetical protein